MNQLLQVSITDFKLIFRDPSLRVFLALPLLIFVVLNYLCPYLISVYPVVNDYVPYILMASITQVSQMFGFIYGIVFIDEKDTQVAKVYGVLPISKTWLVQFRLLIPMFISILITWLILFTQPFYDLSLTLSLLLSVLIGGLTLLYPIVLSVISKNKMEGLTWIKGLNLFIVIPVLAYFVPPAFAKVFVIFPSYWIFQSVYDLIFGGPFLLHLLIAAVFLVALLAVVVHRFATRHFV